MDFIPRLALLYGGIFGAIGVQLPFLPVWFAAKGLDDKDIGFALAIATIVRVVSMPITTRAADHFGNLKIAILSACCVCALFLTGLAMADGVVTIMVLYALASAAGGTTLPLTEAYAWRGLTERGRAYGPVRVWASGAFILAALVTGILQRWIEPSHIIWVVVAVYWYATLASTQLIPVHKAAPTERKARVAELLQSPTLLAVITSSALIQASHAVYYAFGTLHWKQAGIGGFTISLLWITGVVAESFLFVASARFPPRITSTVLIGLGALGAIVRWSVMAFDPPLAVLFPLQCLHAISFAATYLGSVQYIAHSAPPALAATAQGILAALNGLAMAGGMLASGLLFARYGTASYAAMILVAMIGGFAALMAQRFGAKEIP